MLFSMRESLTDTSLTPPLSTIAPAVTLWNSEWTISTRATLKISIDELERFPKNESQISRFDPDRILRRKSTLVPSTTSDSSVTFAASTIIISRLDRIVSTRSQSGHKISPEIKSCWVTFLNESSTESFARTLTPPIRTSWPMFSNLKCRKRI